MEMLLKLQPFRDAPYVRVPQVPVEYRSAPISVPANISISHGLPPTSTIETVANNASNRPRISLLPDGICTFSFYIYIFIQNVCFIYQCI